jgi:hypothetical protein
MHAEVQDQAQFGRDAAQEPNMGTRGLEFDVPHSFPSHYTAGDLHSAFIADYSLVSDLFVLSAITFPIFGGTEDLFAEKAVLFRFLSSVVDGLRPQYLSVRPRKDILRRGQFKPDGIKIRGFGWIGHKLYLSIL